MAPMSRKNEVVQYKNQKVSRAVCQMLQWEGAGERNPQLFHNPEIHGKPQLSWTVHIIAFLTIKAVNMSAAFR